MSGRPAPSTFRAGYYDGKMQHHIEMLQVARRQAKLFRKIGERLVKEWRKRQMTVEAHPGHLSTKATKLTAHEWFGFDRLSLQSGIPQMSQMLDEFVDELDFTEMVEIQQMLTPDKGIANFLGGRLVGAEMATWSNNWLFLDGPGDKMVIPTLNCLKRLSTHCSTNEEWDEYRHSLRAHSILADAYTAREATRLIKEGIGVQASFLPGLGYARDGRITDEMIEGAQKAFPCLQGNAKLLPGGHKIVLDTAGHSSVNSPAIYLGVHDGFIEYGEKHPVSDEPYERWGLFYQQQSGIFCAPLRDPERHPTSVGSDDNLVVVDADSWSRVFTQHPKVRQPSVVGQVSDWSSTEAWNNLLAPTLTMSLKVITKGADGSDAGYPPDDCGHYDDHSKPGFMDALLKGLGAQVFLRVVTDAKFESPPLHSLLNPEALTTKEAKAYEKREFEYVNPVFTHAVSEVDLEDVLGENKSGPVWVDSWKDKRGIKHYNQGDGRYYHNMVRCSECNGRVIVTLPKIPKPSPPFPCPHCKHHGLDVDLEIWSEVI